MKLSRRETEIIVLIASGLPDKEIAQSLKISIRTVQTNVTRICLKLGARNRPHAVTKVFLKALNYT
ncbi:MAG: helix-turn-helix transcriptional regulator [bacterium]